jgi:hypothetical protein
MPKLRLSEVIEEKSIDTKTLNKDIRKAIKTLLAQENTLGKIDKATAEKLRLIAESLNISIFNLFTPSEKFYRLKIFEQLDDSEYLGNKKERLEKLFAKLPSSSKISFNLLAIYSTQILPESLLKSSDLKQVCKVLDVSIEDLKKEYSEPNQTISVEFILRSLDINLDGLSILLDIPKKFIPWISVETIVANQIGSTRFINDTESLSLTEGLGVDFLETIKACDIIGCLLAPRCNTCPNKSPIQ